MSNTNRGLKIGIGCLVLIGALGSVLAYRVGYARGQQEQTFAAEEKRLMRVAAYNKLSGDLGSLVLPLKACKRNPSAFTPEERQMLKDFAKFHIDNVEHAIIPALERGESLEPWPLELAQERKMLALVKKLNSDIN